ncbi:MAG: DUF3488 and transglutaminase-like domain-containing protein [Bifidobacteriaceae bacterium]|jgi:transglutaminase-like putative cysteine protease|nr:DUF3488 and transglutaminase-like domain-containing protein [Bifidobacteriaceae bacterium]
MSRSQTPPQGGTWQPATTVKWHGARPRALTLGGLLDAAAVAAMLAAVLVGFYPVYQGFGFAPAAAGGAVIGLVVAWLATAARLGPLLTAGCTAVLYVLLAAPIALAGTVNGHWLPNGSSLRATVLGAATVWRDFVTASTPVAPFPSLRLVPFIVALATAVLAFSFAWRLNRPAWALLPLGVCLAGVIALGTAQAAWPVAQVAAFGLVALIWLAWRHHKAPVAGLGMEAGGSAAKLRLVRLAGAGAVLAVAAGAVALAGPAVTRAMDRTAVRDAVEPPLDLHQYTSPLVAYHSYVVTGKDEVLFTVLGLPEGGRLRLAVLDAYDGHVYGVGAGQTKGAGTYRRAGSTNISRADGDVSRVTVRVEAAYGTMNHEVVWLPTAGQLTALTFAGSRAVDLQDSFYYDQEAAGAVTPLGLAAGDSYTFEATGVSPVVWNQAAALANTTLVPGVGDLPVPQNVPDQVEALARQLVDQKTDPAERIQALRDYLATGTFSHGENTTASPPGHGAARIQTLLSSDPMVGDDEQYAVAMALMARKLGFSARVVMGFYPDQDNPVAAGQAWQVKGADAHAWVEVLFNGIGWVAIDASPDEDNEQVETPHVESKQENPSIVLPPEDPEKPPVLPPEEMPDDKDTEDEPDDPAARDWAALARLISLIGVPVILLATPFIIIAALKARRRSKRRRDTNLARSVAGGWRELTDYAIDLGVPIKPAATRRENAANLAQRFAAPSVVAVAHRADASVFGPYHLSEAEVTAFWADVATARGELRTGAKRVKRMKAPVALASLRQGRRADRKKEA